MPAEPGAPPATRSGDSAPPPWHDGEDLVVCVDTMVEGVHFPADTDPRSLAHKLLAVNLSDLAAMGAEPLYALVSICTGERGGDWLCVFDAGLRATARAFATTLHSLQTTSGPLTLTAELHGRVPHGAALRRAGAMAGDLVFVTGTLGDAAGALRAWRGELVCGEDDAAYLRARLDRPTPRLAAGRALRGLASACIDVSDGLAADLGHILAASGVGARVELEHLPLSAAMLRCMPREQALALALAGGDDYELCFCLSPSRQPALATRAPYLECALRCIGRVEATAGLRCVAGDGSVSHPRAGWMHFGAPAP